MTVQQPPDECSMTVLRLSDNCSLTARRLPDDYRTTAQWLPDDCLTTAWRLPDDCLTLPDKCLIEILKISQIFFMKINLQANKNAPSKGFTSLQFEKMPWYLCSSGVSSLGMPKNTGTPGFSDLPTALHMYNFLLIDGQILAYIQIPNIKYKSWMESTSNLVIWKRLKDRQKIQGWGCPQLPFCLKNEFIWQFYI